jgi:signal transduction histidine kinase
MAQGARSYTQSALIQNLWKVAGAASIRVKVLGIVIGVIVLLGGFVNLQMRGVLVDVLSVNLEEQGIALVSALARDAAEVLNDEEELAILLAERQIHYSSETHNTIIDYISVEDSAGTILALRGTLPDRSNAVDHRHGRHPVLLLNNGTTVETWTSIPDVDPNADPDTEHVMRLGLSRQGIGQLVDQVTLRLLATTLVMVAVGFAAAFFLTWILTRPIFDLVAATHAVARGDFSKRITRWADDEIGELAIEFNKMTAALEKADQERHERERLREEYISGVILAQENERQRIARELHDSTSQSLTSLLVGLQTLRQCKDEEETRARVDELRGVIGGVLDEIHDISWRLRPSVLDDLGLISALESYVNEYRKRYEIPVDMVIRGLDARLQPEIETTVYRIVQEGLTNIARYAKANSVSVIVSGKNDSLKIIIEDDGVGFDPNAVRSNRKSLGLQGIRERAGLFGGTLTIETAPGQGTTLFVEIPCTTSPIGTQDKTR